MNRIRQAVNTTILAAAVMLAAMLAVSALPIHALPAHAQGLEPDTSWYSDSEVQFTLRDAADLTGLSDLVNAGNSFEGKTILLADDIDLESLDEEWTPIGNNSDTPFSGVFDGQGHRVANMSFSVES